MQPGIGGVTPARSGITAEQSLAGMSEGTRMLLFCIMALGMFMSLLDIQIVAASLPEITAGLSAGADEGSWIQTSYLIAEIVMIPLSAFLSQAFSTRWVFTASAAAFTVSSLACGFAWNLESAITFRAIQGFVGGAMVPTVFATGFTLFKGRRQALIPAILGTTATLAPIIGPTLGGWITDVLNWRWLFFINVVPGIAITLLVPIYGHIDDPDPDKLKGFDAWSIPLLALFLGGLIYVLEEGPRHDWFADDAIRMAAVAAALGAMGFFYRSLTHARPVIDLSVFRNSRFAMGSLFQFMLGVGIFTAIYLIPQFLAQVQHYRSLDIGLAVAVTGLAQIVATPISARISQQVDPRHVIVFGFSLFALSCWLTTPLASDWGGAQLFLPQILRGFSIMFCIVPATNLCLAAMPPQQLKAASGLSNLMRNLGGAVGIAAANTLLNDRYRLHFSQIAERLTPSNPALATDLAQLQARAAQVYGGTVDAGPASLRLLLDLVNREARSLTFADAFLLISLLFIAVLVVIPFSKPIKPGSNAAPASH